MAIQTPARPPVGIPDSPEKAVLDRVPNPQADTKYLARFTFPEFTSICPVTGQPDFGVWSSITCQTNGSSNPSP